MDIGKKSPVELANEGAALTLKHPNGKSMTYEVDVNGSKESRPVRIWVAGRDSDRWRKANRELVDMMTERAEQERKLTNKEVEAETLKIHAKMFLKWEGIEENGTPLECNEENAIRLMRWGPFIADQVSQFISDRSNFMTA